MDANDVIRVIIEDIFVIAILVMSNNEADAEAILEVMCQTCLQDGRTGFTIVLTDLNIL